MKTLKIYKKEYQRIGYDIDDVAAQEYMEISATYNDADKMTREERYNSDSTLNTLTINTYNDQNLLISMEQYDQDHTLLQKSLNKYNDKQILVQQSNFFGEDTSEYVTKFTYDDQNNLLSQAVYFEGKLENVEKSFEYKNNRLVKETDNNDYGQTQYVTTHEYNDQGWEIKRVRDEIIDKDRRTYEYEYDDRGNRIKELVYDFKDALIAKTYSVYDDNNRLVETEEEDLDNYRKIKLEYDGNNVSRNTLLDKKGKITGWADYAYNEDNKEILSQEYIIDEINPEEHRLLRETRYERLS